jgi:response regulator of citrate/malate metabolism
MSGHKKSASSVTPDADLAKWCAALAPVAAPVDVVPVGWMTAQALAGKLKIPKATMQQRLKRLFDQGSVERKRFRVKLAQNTRPVAHYRLLK